MKKTICKWFWTWDFEKEEKWLNEMATKGLHLCEIGYCRYVFEEGIPGEYIYRLEMLDNYPAHAKSVEYIQFLEDTEAEYIGAMLRWVYFRKKSGGSGFDLFSDIDSRIRHLNRMLPLTGFVSGLNLFNGVNNIYIGLFSSLNVHLVTGILCLSIGVMLGFGFLNLFSRKRRLEKAKILHE